MIYSSSIRAIIVQRSCVFFFFLHLVILMKLLVSKRNSFQKLAVRASYL